MMLCIPISHIYCFIFIITLRKRKPRKQRTGALCMQHSPTAFREINSFGWYNNTVKNSSVTTKHLYLILTFRSHYEIFIRRSWYTVLPSLDATISCRIKKAFVGVTQLVTALVSIHSSMTFLADMYSFLDPPGRTVLFSVDDRSVSPVDCVIGLIRMISECLVVIDEFLTVQRSQLPFVGSLPQQCRAERIDYKI